MTQTVPEEFTKIIKDFVGDLKFTFPEYLPLINKWWKDKSTFDYIEDADERLKAINIAEQNTIIYLFDFCKRYRKSLLKEYLH